MKIYKSFYQIGIFDATLYPTWPWHSEYEHGMYLSAKKRVCSWKSPAEFETPKDARIFFRHWKQSTKYQMELIEVKRLVDIPAPVYPPDHPASIMKRIRESESRSKPRMIAALWFSGNDALNGMSVQTKKKYRAILLAYGIDIFERPSAETRRLWDQSDYRNFSDVELNSGPNLTVVK